MHPRHFSFSIVQVVVLAISPELLERAEALGMNAVLLTSLAVEVGEGGGPRIF